jgi:glucose-6-phosphate 1-dehydrogenase
MGMEVVWPPRICRPMARLLVEALEGDPALFIRSDEAEECWRIVEPILEHWECGEPSLLTYPAGSIGPDLSPAKR